MSKYRFEYVGGQQVSIVVDLPDHNAATEEATRMMNEVVDLRGREATGFAIKIYDENEHLVAVVKSATFGQLN